MESPTKRTLFLILFCHSSIYSTPPPDPREVCREFRNRVVESAQPHFVRNIVPVSPPNGILLPNGILYGRGTRFLEQTIEHRSRQEPRDVLYLEGADPNTGYLSFQGNRIEWVVQEARNGTPVVGSHNRLIQAYLDHIASPHSSVTATLEFSNEAFIRQTLTTISAKFSAERARFETTLQEESRDLPKMHAQLHRIDRRIEYERELADKIALKFYSRILRMYPSLRNRAIRLDIITDSNGNNERFAVEILSAQATTDLGGPRLVNGGAFIRSLRIRAQRPD